MAAATYSVTEQQRSNSKGKKLPDRAPEPPFLPGAAGGNVRGVQKQDGWPTWGGIARHDILGVAQREIRQRNCRNRKGKRGRSLMEKEGRIPPGGVPVEGKPPKGIV